MAKRSKSPPRSKERSRQRDSSHLKMKDSNKSFQDFQVNAAQNIEQPKPEVQFELSGDEIRFACDGNRCYRIRGLDRNLSPQQLKVNILAEREQLVHVDTLDLYKARARNLFTKAVAAELATDSDTVKRDIGKILLKLEQLRHEQIELTTQLVKPVEPTAAEKQAAMSLLQDPNLINRILQDLEACGLAGERSNKLISFLACVSRKLDTPLALLVQSGSAAGKTTLMEKVLAFMPEEDQILYSSMTARSLYYFGEQNIKHKILAISEDEGVSNASYPLKILQSDGKLTIARVEKSSVSGRQSTETYTVEGPVMMFLTTTCEQPDPELQNRCITIRVNESPEQTAAIHVRQRTNYLHKNDNSNNEKICLLHKNAQRMLASLPVIMPWAQQLTFRSDQTRMRRDNAKYLTLIASVTLLHQHQRRLVELGTDKVAVESTIDDVQLANQLISETMGQSLDELLPQTRQLLVLIEKFVNQCARSKKINIRNVRFTQRQLREKFGWGEFQLRRHLKRLVELEYVLAHRTGYSNVRHYQLLYDGQGRDGASFLLGLVDPKKLA